MDASPRRILRAGARLPPSYIVFAVLLVALWIVRPNFMNVTVLGTFVRQVAPLGIVVLGQLLVVACRSIDLSAGGLILIVNYALSSGLLGTLPPLLQVGLCLVVGLVVGLSGGSSPPSASIPCRRISRGCPWSGPWRRPTPPPA